MTTLPLPAVPLDGGLSQYFQQVFRFPVLKGEEEYMLAKRWKEHGDVEAAHELVTSHLRLVAKIAMSYRGYGLPVAGSELLTAVRNRGDELFIGALFGAVVLGIYSIARRYIDALRSALPAVIGDHAWPVLASLRDEKAGFTRQLRRSLVLTAAFVWPVFVVT